ncbi:MAG: NAD(P)-dependent glycerol-3-phosphate dehydrogenase [Treponema sp.]|nr:NAD(P)-dependent glycerol-3-phosphate dehydrogenase [Treponema sp.]MCL2272064.1 NAD(P)-dependent glycerol-3-phosphate dehydrogenase [Treponema sp.]
MNAQITVLGAGAWGTAIAKVIAEKENDVVIWSFEKETRDDINQRHRNTRYLPDVELPQRINATSDIEEAAEGKQYLIFAVPSLFLLDTVRKILNVSSIREGKTIIAVLTKGFLPSENGPRLIVETMEDYLPGFYQKALVYISGPSHAEEVSTGKMTGLIAASENPKNSIRFRDVLKSQQLFVYSSLDIRGVQVSAASKNVIAIAFGMLDAIKSIGGSTVFGDGTESLLLAAGLNEIQTLGKALGATHPETFTSIAGIGDLDVTCRSVFGRNRRFGREIIEKNILEPFRDIDDILARIGEIGYLPEGIAAAKYIKELAEKHKLKMPVSMGLSRLLNRELDPYEFIQKFLDGLR